MNLKSRFKTTRNSRWQFGVTLILAVVILASVSVISFSLGGLVLREISSSRQLAQSEPVIISAEAGGESALFFRIRKLSAYSQICPAASQQTLSSGAQFAVCSDLYDNPYIFATSFDKVEVVVLDKPEDPGNPAADYGSVTITATSGTAVLLKAEAFDLNSPSAPPLTATIGVPGSGTLSLDPAKSYALFLYPCGSPPCSSGNVSGSITGTASDGSPKGIPSKSPTIESTGSRGELIRKLEIFLSQ